MEPSSAWCFNCWSNWQLLFCPRNRCHFRVTWGLVAYAINSFLNSIPDDTLQLLVLLHNSNLALYCSLKLFLYSHY